MTETFHSEVWTISSFTGRECSPEKFWHLKTVLCVFRVKTSAYFIVRNILVVLLYLGKPQTIVTYKKVVTIQKMKISMNNSKEETNTRCCYRQ